MISPQTLATLKGMIAAVREQMADDDADETFRADMLEGSTTIDEVLSLLARARLRARHNQIGAAVAKQEAGSYYDRRIAIAEREEEAADRMIRAVLEAAGLPRFKVPEGSISIQDGRLSLHLDPDFNPPQGYTRAKITPDNAAIKAALEAGEKMPGASLVRGQPIVRIT
jgi:hypothetical protein